MQRIYTTPQQRIHALQQNEYFNQLDVPVLEELSQEMCLCAFEPGEILFWDGDPCDGLYTLVTGSVKLFKVSPNGREIILQVLEEGTVFNEVPVFDEGHNPVSVAALEPCTVWIVSAQSIRAGLLKYPLLARSVIDNLSKNLRRLVRLVEELSFYQVTHRLARLISELPPENLQGEAPQRLTQDQIAARLGTVREVVGRSLRELERSGAIEVSRGRIQIINRSVLGNWIENLN
ncbi:MAG: Crp/Fnr family transcriptional regulator [Anaerolineales bacterium]